MPRVIYEEFRIRPSASERDLKEFQQSYIWRDIESYIKQLLDESYEFLKSSEDFEVLLKSQGCVRVAEDILDLPNKMIEWAKEDDEFGGQENDTD